MDKQEEIKEYKVLGHKIRLKESSDQESISPDEVVSLLNKEILAIKQNAVDLDDSQVVVLVALKLAQEKLAIEKDFRYNMSSLQRTAKEALKLIEEVVPSAH